MKAIDMLKQRMPCGKLIIARVWEDTTSGWNAANERLSDAVDRHYIKCPDCSAALEKATKA